MGKIICLYGLPACGKTTQLERLVKELGASQFGMGERLRAEIQTGSELGQQIKTYVDQGLLINDELMKKVIENVGEEIKNNSMVFDGFPRMLSQALMLDNISDELSAPLSFFYLKISREEAVNRIAARSEIGGRAD